MQFLKRLDTIVLLTTLLASLSATAADPAPSGRDILERVEAVQRAVSDNAFNRVQLSSCQFGVQDNQITCAERPRVKALETVSINTGDNGLDTKMISIVREPAAERGIGMLSYTYDSPDIDNETWLYLSALGQVKRIASGNSDDNSEPASIFGSEFTTEDQDTGKLDEYEIRIVREDNVSGREVWVIESIPNAERARKTRYARTLQYVDKSRFVVMRSDMYNQQGREIKRLMASRIEQVNGNWTARSLTMMNLIANRLSNMAILEIHNGLDIPEAFLTPRTLTDVAFREAELGQLREQVD